MISIKKLFPLGLLSLAVLAACHKKKSVEGSISYAIEYILPDSLKQYEEYLPNSAKVYFKDDSTISIQQINAESTTIITHKPTDFMRVLLTSSTKKYVIDYNTAEQLEEAQARLGYSYSANSTTNTIAGYKTSKYTLTDKATGENAEAWFTKDVKIIPNSLTMPFDTTYGVPLFFTTTHNGITTKTTVKEIKFEPVPDGIFLTPKGYETLTPKQLREMPVAVDNK